MIYLDANATTPMLPEVLEAMLPWMRDGYANPNGAHRAGRAVRAAIERAREQVAALIGAHPDEVIFTSGGTEGANTILRSLDALATAGHGLCSAIEHSCVLRTVENLTNPVIQVGVGRDGRVDLTELQHKLEGAGWVAVMAANNETGVIQPLAEVVQMAKAQGLVVFTDAVQAAGRVPLSMHAIGVDFASFSAHKFHGPKGVGAMFCKRGMALKPWLFGGGQERGYRSGTENAAAIVGMGCAAELAMRYLQDTHVETLARWRDDFESMVLAGLTGVQVNGRGAPRLANTSHLSFEGCDAAGLLIVLDDLGVACSAGSACMTGKQKPSHVQAAMGISENLAKSSLRFSFSRMNLESDAREAASRVIKGVEKLRKVQGQGVGPVVVYSPRSSNSD